MSWLIPRRFRSTSSASACVYPPDIPWRSLTECKQLCETPCTQHEQADASTTSRIDMTSDMVGSVKPYTKQWLLCTGAMDWPQKIEQAMGLASALGRESASLSYRVLITACDRPTASPTPAEDLTNTDADADEEAMDILALPERILVHNVTKTTAALFVQSMDTNHMHESLRWSPLPTDLNHVVLICAHQRRDKRCGVMGPLLREQFHTELCSRGLDGKVAVYLTSHFGGHKFAGNVIVYPGGHWYGRVQTCHVPVIVDEHLVQGKVLQELWRGRMDVG